ncbi:MAG TPA: hypothetical protein VMB80_10845 [Candidatus Acidoferrum sp.]|nr:hypothetical protein [Candidatus Acidoferrum sp.]
MIWLNLFAAVLISGYAQWLFYRGWRYFRDLSGAANAEQVLKNVMEQRRFYLIQGVTSLAALVLVLGIKALLLFFNLPEASAFTVFVFGDFASRFLIVKLGCVGVVLVLAAVICFYQFIKSQHYLDVLYALRDVLGLAPEHKIAKPPPLPAEITARQVI